MECMGWDWHARLMHVGLRCLRWCCGCPPVPTLTRMKSLPRPWYFANLTAAPQRTSVGRVDAAAGGSMPCRRRAAAGLLLRIRLLLAVTALDAAAI